MNTETTDTGSEREVGLDVDTPTPPDLRDRLLATVRMWEAEAPHRTLIADKALRRCAADVRLALATPDPSIPERPDPRLTGKLRRRFEDVLARLDEPKMGNPKYGMDRRAIEGELRAIARDSLDLADAVISAALAIPERPAEPLREALTVVERARDVTLASLDRADPLYMDDPEVGALRAAVEAYDRAALAQQGTPDTRLHKVGCTIYPAAHDGFCPTPEPRDE